MNSKLTKSALLVALTLTAIAALPHSMVAQEAGDQIAAAGQLNITWNINLSGQVFLGARPVGAAEYEVEGSRRRFSAEADNVNLANGSSLTVYVAGKRVGSFTLTDGGGALLLDTFAHQSVPYINRGTVVAIYYGSTRLLSGKF